MTARRGGPFQPVNTLSRDSSRVSSGGMFHRTSSHSTSAKRPLDTHAVAGGNVRKEWDLHDEAGYGRANKKNRTEDHLAPGRQANGGKGSMATVGEADEALDRSRIVKRKTSSSPSVTSQGLPRRKTTNASSKGGVTEYQAVEQLMSQRSGSSRTIDERQSFKELESYQPEKAQEGQYRGTANLRPPKRAGNDEMRVANGARKQSAPTSVKTSISAARLTPNRAPQRASKPGTEQVPKISVRPQSGSGAGQTTRPRALRDLAIRSNGTVDEVDELESPDPLQAGISVERRTRQDIHADSPAGYSKNAGRGPSDSASKESFALREISSAADIPSTQFTKSNRREVLQISRACIAGSKDGSTWTGEITLVRCGRHDVRMTDELPIFLHLRNGHVEFREGDNILSEISLDLAFKVDDIQSLLRAVDGPKMEIIKHRASNTDNRVDLEFSSNTSAQAFVKRVQQLNRRVVVQDKES
ncbi:MAG: hypothetical protein M1832_002843 [Thelocarpon impressellum]|nr:MAG: hypothetical protein M1832_002843 [Thelocarpon impressellum]